jgi:hypothetical protein
VIGFFEHLGLVGGFLLVAWHDLKGDDLPAPPPRAGMSRS